MTEAALTTTIKAGTGYDAPWVVIRADNPEQMTAYLTAIGNVGVLAAAANTATEFAGIFAAAKGLPAAAVAVEPAPPAWGTQQTAPAFQQAQQPQGYAPPQAAPAQAGAPLDQFGKSMKYVESKPGAAKKWKAWMGDYPQGDPKDKLVQPVWLH
jgi:hypothetical protein